MSARDKDGLYQLLYLNPKGQWQNRKGATGSYSFAVGCKWGIDHALALLGSTPVAHKVLPVRTRKLSSPAVKCGPFNEREQAQ